MTPNGRRLSFKKLVEICYFIENLFISVILVYFSDFTQNLFISLISLKSGDFIILVHQTV